MLRYLLGRLLATVPVLLVVAVIVFGILRLTPGDPAAVIAGNSATPEDVARIRQSLGLERPIIHQFVGWIQQLAQGDIGQSYYLGKPVAELISDRLEPTISLAVGSLLLAIVVAVPLGTWAAWRMGGLLDRTLMAVAVAGFSIPVFVAGYVLILAFSLGLQWLPVQGYRPWSVGFVEWARQLVLPWTALAIVYVALLSRVTRAAVSEALTEDYIRTAQAKGLPALRILLRHALPNAAIPIVTVIGISFAMLIGGVVVTETVFAIPGLGSLTVDAVLNRDFPVIQGVVLFFSAVYVLLNLAIDLSYALFDPRIRY
ncbi:MAG: peptide ABC transporter [Burkholderiales bacterium 68-12]|nr:MAG: peptide ABC transporter [Burkholderiales bacterium 68-12]